MAGKYEALPQGSDWRRLFRVGDVRPSPPDPRDFPALARSEAPVTLPASFRLPERPIRNQGGKGACTAFAFARIAERGLGAADLSEDEMYARLRVPYDWICQDTGSYPRDCADVCVTEGWLTEAARPYDDRDLCTPPHPDRLTLGAPYRGREYRAARSWEDVKQILYQFGVGVTFCLTVFDSFFDTGADGIMPAPSGPVAGGHCLCVEGWDEQYAWVANSWSAGWGQRGYVRVPLRYVDGSVGQNAGGLWTSDLWTVLMPAPEPQPQPEPEPEDPMSFAEGFAAAQRQALALLDESVIWYTDTDPSPYAVDLCRWHRDQIAGWQPPAGVRRTRPRPAAPSPTDVTFGAGVTYPSSRGRTS